MNSNDKLWFCCHRSAQDTVTTLLYNIFWNMFRSLSYRCQPMTKHKNVTNGNLKKVKVKLCWLLISSISPPLLPSGWPATSASASHCDPALLLPCITCITCITYIGSITCITSKTLVTQRHSDPQIGPQLCLGPIIIGHYDYKSSFGAKKRAAFKFNHLGNIK